MENDKLNSDQKTIKDFVYILEQKEDFDAKFSLETLINKLQKTLDGEEKNSDSNLFIKKVSIPSSSIFHKKSKIISSNKEANVNFDHSVYNDPDLDINQRISHIVYSVFYKETDITEMPACRHLTVPGVPNSSSNYPYANDAFGAVCTNPDFLSPGLKHVVCGHYPGLKSCVGYNPDYSLISTTSIDDIDHYLIRYRKISTSISYLFADYNGTVYNTITYPYSASLENDNLDELALGLFSSHLSDLSSLNISSDFCDQNLHQNTIKKVSYLSYVME